MHCNQISPINSLELKKGGNLMNCLCKFYISEVQDSYPVHLHSAVNR